MTLKAILLALGPLATALVPPCLPELGPQFCPGTAEASLIIQNDECTQDRMHSPTIYPEMTQQSLLKDEIFPLLNKTYLEEGVRLFTLPKWRPNRHCKSQFGILAKDWIGISAYDMMDEVLKDTSIPFSFKYVENETPQSSIIFRVMPPGAPFQPGNTIVIGAHMDSKSIKRTSNQPNGIMVAPGADDNASGTLVLLSVLKALGRLLASKPVTNEVQFHWYGAEEVGLLGSKSVFERLRNESYTVKASLNFDMVGYAGAHELGFPKMALQQGFADKNLTAFVANLVKTYTNAEPELTNCGYPCSDHASAHQNGFPSAMIGESSYLTGKGGAPSGNPNIHSENDTIETLDFDYMLEFAKVAAAFVTELAYTNFTELEKGRR